MHLQSEKEKKNVVHAKQVVIVRDNVSRNMCKRIINRPPDDFSKSNI